MTTPVPLSTLELFQQSWGRLLADFRQWIMADTADLRHWQSRALPEAIRACPGRMIDDAEGMLAEWRQNQNVAGKPGSTALLPVMLTAFEPVASVPDVSSIRGVADWIEVQIPSDTQGRTVQMRTIPTAIRAQIAIFTATPHSAFTVASQFCAYLTSEKKRQLPMRVHFGAGLHDDWQLTVLDNSLIPSRIQSDAKNLSIVAVDVVLNGLVPQIVGLGSATDATTDPDGIPAVNQPVVEVDFHSAESGMMVRWVIDTETGDTTLITLTNAQVLILESGNVLRLEDGRYLRLA